MSIEKIWAREILDSRGNPTVEVDLYTAKGNGCGMGLPTALAFPRPGWVRPGVQRPFLIPRGMGCWARLTSLGCGGWILPVRGARVGGSVFEFSV